MQRRALLLAGASTPWMTSWARAQDGVYPSKPIRLNLP